MPSRVAFAALAIIGAFVSSMLPSAQRAPRVAPQPLNMTIPQVNGTGAINGMVTDAATKKPIACASDEPAWVPFRWFPATVGSKRIEHAALLIPAALDQMTGMQELQLDLGAELFSLSGGAVGLTPAAKREYDATASVTLSGTIAGYRIAREIVSEIEGYVPEVVRGQPLSAVGSVGLRFFEHRILIIDYSANRIAILDEGIALPALIEHSSTFLPIVYRSGKLFIPTEIGGMTYPSAFFFDTGAGPFPLVTDQNDWRRLTGRSEDDKNNEVLTVSGWGRDLTLVGAPSRTVLRVGPAEIRVPTVYFLADPPSSTPGSVPFAQGTGALGLLGNALFVDRSIVTVDLPHRRFGILNAQQ